MNKKIVYIISRLHVSDGFLDLFEKLKSDGIFLQILLLNKTRSVLYENLSERGFFVEEYIYTGKRDILKTTQSVYHFLKKHNPEIIHTHLIDAGFVGAIAGWFAKVPLRIYTRHHGDMHFYENKKGRFYDLFLQFFYHKIIALSSGHLKLLSEKEGLSKKIVLIPNFFDTKIFNVSDDRISTIQKKYRFNDQEISIGINARWTEWKGVHFIIQAFIELNKTHHNLKLYLFNASGDYSNNILSLLKLLPTEKYCIVKFERDMMAVYKNLNFFVHTPVRDTAESFGLVYIEALGSGLPCVFTRSGIACDVVVDGENALVVPFKSSNSIKNALERLLRDKQLAYNLSHNNFHIPSKFTLDLHVGKLYQLYQQ